VHFPQDEIARAEAYLIAKTSNQYLVPKDGSPLRGLIQDHVVSGVLMTKKDSFFTLEELQEYVYIACETMGSKTQKIEYLPPTILKPKKLWTGKQIIGSILMNLTRGSPPLSMESKTKIPADCWGKSSALEAVVRFRNNELLHGVLDKSQFGASMYGLVHCVYELYGPPAAGTLLTCLGRIFSSFIQRQRGFTCGIEDFILTEGIEDHRSGLLSNAQVSGMKGSAEFASDLLPENVDLEKIPQKAVAEALRQKLGREDVVNASQTPSAALDSKIKSVLNEVTSGVIKAALHPSSSGLVKKFPKNNLALMTLSGAKGSNVNFSQISCLLGQQELEGRRVPRTCAGRTLPSFAAYDPTARAGGYITNRFLSGIRPQEYYFHCMAGREGLVDTAVKTSRSGYLQRCLIKHLENVRVHYDSTVRDDSRDGMVIQFAYGEDSVEVSTTPYLYKDSQFKFLAENYTTVLKNLNPAGALQVLDADVAKKYRKKLKKQKEKDLPLSDPCISVLPPSSHLGSVSEKFESLVSEFVEKNEEFLEELGLSKKKFEAMMALKYIKSLINPGEPVGVLTAQSIGEPSTQMTLNTFHLAGFGGANVTLGIPRLREIIMTAASKISTPLMQLFLEKPLGIGSKDRIDRLAHALQKVTLNDISEGVAIREKSDLVNKKKSIFVKIYYSQNVLDKYELSLKRLNKIIKKTFVPLLEKHSQTELTGEKKRRRVMDEEDLSDIEDVPFTKETDEENVKEEKTEKKKKNDVKNNSDSDESDSDAEESDDNVDDEEGVEDVSMFDEKKEEEEEVVLEEYLLLGSDKVKFYSSHFEVKLDFDMNSNCLLSMNTVELCCHKTVIRHVPGITDCYMTQPQNKTFAEDGEYAIQTDGADFKAVWQLAAARPDLEIDVNRIYSNHIHLIMMTYGVEAARNALVGEIRSVFSVYGISVDPRHLFVLADFMTSEGGFRAMSRHGMASASSPLLKITFETSTNFMTNCLLYGEYDDCKTVSSRIFTGRPMNGGTGSFDLMQPIQIK
jgi:DNA-directed RNA polymerase I subunit RPA1